MEIQELPLQELQSLIKISLEDIECPVLKDCFHPRVHRGNIELTGRVFPSNLIEVKCTQCGIAWLVEGM